MLLHLLIHSGQGDQGVVAVQEDGELDVLAVVGMLSVGVTEVLDLRLNSNSNFIIWNTEVLRS